MLKHATLIFLIAMLLGAIGCDRPRRAKPNTIDEIRRIEDTRDERSTRLVKLMATGRPRIRLSALLAAGRIQSPAYLESLIAAAGDESAEIRRAALFAIGQLGLRQSSSVPVDALGAVRQAMNDADPLVRADAVEAFGKLGSAEISEELIAPLSDEDAQVRGIAAMAMFRCRFTPLWRGEVETPPQLPESATVALVDALRDEDAEVRYRAVYAFSRYGEPLAVNSLIERAADDDWRVRLFAVRGIGNSQPDETARAALVRSLTDARQEIRVEAVQALAGAGASELLPASCLTDSAYVVRAACAAGWSGGDDERSTEALEQLRNDPVLAVRVAALRAQVARGGKGLDRRLDAAAQDESWQIRAVSAGAGVKGRQRLKRARHGFEDSDSRVRTAALEGLAAVGGARSLLLRALAEDDLAVRGSAVAEIGAMQDTPGAELRGALEAAYQGSAGLEWIEVREGIVDSVKESPKAIELMREMLVDDAPSVRRKASAALAEHGIDIEPPPFAIGPSPYLRDRHASDPQVVLHMERGEIVIRCFAQEAPVHVAAFLDLVHQQFYSDLSWHRVVPNFVIQGGDPRGDGWGGAGFTLRDEIGRRRFERGSVGMPKAGKDTGGGQLFITHIPTPHLDGNYTIFGQVIEGLELVDAIEIGDKIIWAEVR